MPSTSGGVLAHGPYTASGAITTIAKLAVARPVPQHRHESRSSRPVLPKRPEKGTRKVHEAGEWESSGGMGLLKKGLQAGTITKLVVQQKQPHRVTVFLDGLCVLEVSQTLVLEYGLRVGRSLSVEEQERLRSAERLLAAKATALQYMTYRPRTAHEVRQRLRRGGYETAVVEQVMEHLHAHRTLDDAAYAHAYLKARRDIRRDGPQRIRHKLRQRGVCRALIDEAMQQELTAADVLEAARAQAAKYWPRLSREADPAKRRKKLGDFLRRRGFPFATVQQVVKELEDGEDESG
jgi:regulatory protein